MHVDMYICVWIYEKEDKNKYNKKSLACIIPSLNSDGDDTMSTLVKATKLHIYMSWAERKETKTLRKISFFKRKQSRFLAVVVVITPAD